MRRFFTLFAMPLALTMAMGCTNPFDDDENTNPGTHVYLPLKVGATWTYDRVGNDTDDIPHTDTITGTVEYKGKTYWVSERSLLLNQVLDPDTTRLRVDGDIVYMSITGEFFSKPVSTTLPYEFPTMRFGLPVQMPWDSFSITLGSSTLANIITCLGYETVTVPAGTFENCLKMQIKATDFHAGDGYASPSTATTIHTEWFAPNVGLVRKLTQSQDYMTVPDENWDSTREFVLTSYTIP